LDHISDLVQFLKTVQCLCNFVRTKCVSLLYYSQLYRRWCIGENNEKREDFKILKVMNIAHNLLIWSC